MILEILVVVERATTQHGIIPIILAGLAIAGAVAKASAAKTQADVLADEQKRIGKRTADPYIKEMAELTRTQLNGRAAGAAQAEQNIMQQQANTMASINRNALDASQVMALAGATQGRTNEALLQLATQEEKAKEGAIQRHNNSLQLKAQDDANVWADKLRDYNMTAAINGTKLQNEIGAMDSAISGVAAAGGMAKANKGWLNWNNTK